jgi:hypothetical protein
MHAHINSQFHTNPLVYDIDRDGVEDVMAADTNGRILWIKLGEFGQYVGERGEEGRKRRERGRGRRTSTASVCVASVACDEQWRGCVAVGLCGGFKKQQDSTLTPPLPSLLSFPSPQVPA